jgi:hypothetical protein
MLKRMLSAKFDFNDFLKQFKAINKMGPLNNVMKMIPGMNQFDDKQLEGVERKYAMFESIIQVRITIHFLFSQLANQNAIPFSFQGAIPSIPPDLFFIWSSKRAIVAENSTSPTVQACRETALRSLSMF